MRYIYLLSPVLTIFLLLGLYWLVKSNDRPIPQYVRKNTSELQTWTPEEYYRHLNMKPFDGRALHALLIRRTFQKPGVYLENLLPVMDTAGIEVVNVYHTILGDDYTPVITSGNDYPYHKRFSRHYFNAAIDFRIVNVPMRFRKQIADSCSARLGPRFRVLWERGAMEHLHVELKEVNNE